MKILKVMVIGVEGGTISKCDGIEYEGKLWLVPNWLDIPAQGVTKPARLIRFDTLPHEALPAGSAFGDYILNMPMPTELFGHQTPRQAIPGFEFQELPEITLPLKDRTAN
jgi:hypothetical protein